MIMDSKIAVMDATYGESAVESTLGGAVLNPAT
jgi:hypothetical protein